MDKRIIWADSLRGFLMIMVVLGHVIQKTLGDSCETDHLWNAIYSFHMSAFMAVSGFLAYRPNCVWGGVRCVSQALFRRFRQLIVPFILWSILLIVSQNRLSVNSLVDCLLYPDQGGLWFLWVLFFINVLFVIGSWLAEKLRIKQELVVLSICLVLVGLMLILGIRIFGFQFIAYYFIFYSLGFFIHKYSNIILTSNKMALVFLFCCWAFLAWNWQMHELPFFLKHIQLPSTLLQYLYRFITAVIAIYILIPFASLSMNGSQKWNSSLASFGKLSLGVYAVHIIIVSWIVSIYQRLINNDYLTILLSLIITVLLSWLIVWLLSKWRITNKWLLGKI